MMSLLSAATARVGQSAGAVLLAGGLICGASAAQASTIDSIVVGSLIYEEFNLDVIADDFLFEASVFSLNDVFVGAPLDGFGNVDALAATGADLDITDAFFDPVINGRAIDIGVDTGNDTISILYRLGENTLSSDGLALAVLFFPTVDMIDPFAFDQVDFSTADLEIYGATVIPLPAGLPLMLAGLGGFAVLRCRRTRKRT